MLLLYLSVRWFEQKEKRKHNSAYKKQVVYEALNDGSITALAGAFEDGEGKP